MQQDATHYRGYVIKMQRPDLCWRYRLERDWPRHPGFGDQQFCTATQSKRTAMAQARRQIDYALDPRKTR
jgi:hypothetical protein